MPHPIFSYSTLGLAVMLEVLGLNAMIRPNAHLRSLEFPAPTEPQAKKFSYALMRIWGVRNITVGCLVTLVWTTGDEKLMGKALTACLALPIIDGFVSRGLIGGGEAQHWMVPPIMGVIIAGLFGWFGQ
ncbi:hypothetical protein Plec18167_006986 [Paecilomyces lecythidis]|uniref:Integral membrane protein n=1 Tax=Paecilomyces lecythidis TaxID=3004212 RepID=A0ABR3X7P1_9EURO